MKNFLTEKLLLDTKHGSNCTLELCNASDPDNDVVIYKGTCCNCLRKVAYYKLGYSGDEYLCLYTNIGCYDGTNFNEVSWRMGISPDSLMEILGLREASVSAEDLNRSADQEIHILSLEKSYDLDYGNTIVQYQIGDIISFSFSNIAEYKAILEPELVIQDLQKTLNQARPMPTWSMLSKDLIGLVLENPFDMHFVEYGDNGWPNEMEDILWDEVCKLGINGGITCGEDDALATVYPGAMGYIDWTNHPQYGKPCFEHKFENNVFIDEVKPSLNHQIESAQNVVEQKANTGHSFYDHSLDL